MRRLIGLIILRTVVYRGLYLMFDDIPEMFNEATTSWGRGGEHRGAHLRNYLLVYLIAEYLGLDHPIAHNLFFAYGAGLLRQAVIEDSDAIHGRKYHKIVQIITMEIYTMYSPPPFVIKTCLNIVSYLLVERNNLQFNNYCYSTSHISNLSWHVLTIDIPIHFFWNGPGIKIP